MTIIKSLEAYPMFSGIFSNLISKKLVLSIFVDDYDSNSIGIQRVMTSN